MNKKILIIVLLIILSLIGCLYLSNTTYFKTHIAIFLIDSKQIIKYGPKNQKVIALTFDDGPHPRFTPQILDLLKKYDAKATFFVLGRHVELYPTVIKRAVAEGHEIGNHTYTHIDIKNTSLKKLQNEFEKTQNIIFSVTGIKPKIFRPPFGFCTEKVIKLANQNDCKIILWSNHQDSKDWSNPGVQKIIKKTLSNVENGDIILLHDYVEGPSQTIEALKTILPELKNRGYEFVTISKLITLSSNNE
ncbi:polysaccharide deacetylase family protein [Crassaminicella thermophila]|uniref:Polysaccharide deacetylase family protein n=1 Tax=Crassaminicella thermophila TaxID=2599308 RepID=A0A5C0SGJ2_CRATE|nr:polysaccharide deacetylase family protein [Crassaminicella thermophila]QEK13431.1 polysaccharide deacetylase family protein [Crassaminicella thermophila]